jgi:DNA invertase Pin-like site-specific DNA recombinase
LTAALYLRKSRAEEDMPIAETLARHKDTLIRFAVANDIQITEVYEEVVSGDSLFARPAMLRLLDGIDAYDAVLCMDIDRLGRGNMKEQGIILETLKTADVKIITPRKVYDLNNEMDETYSEFESFMARQELKMIKRRMQRGIRKSAEEGCHMGTAPYGYRNVRVNGKSTLEIVSDQAKIVRLIFEMYLSGSGVNLIANRLNDMSIPPLRVARWDKVCIRKILKNDVYIGRITYGRVLRTNRPGSKAVIRPPEQWIKAPGLHQPIIDTETFERVQEIMRKKHRPAVKDNLTIRNPFAGVIKCMQCGRALEHHPYKGHEYLLCKTKGCVRMSNLKYIEAAFLTELKSQLDTLLSTENAAAPNAETLSLINSLEAELENQRKQKERLHDLLERGAYSIEVFRQRGALLAERIASTEKSLAAEKTKDAQRQNRASVVIPRIQEILQFYSNGTPEEKNKLIKAAVSRVFYFKERDASPKDFTLQLEFIAPQSFQ